MVARFLHSGIGMKWFLAALMLSSALTLSGSFAAGSPSPAVTTWVTQIDDRFDSGGVPDHWNLYDGPYGSDPHNCASPNHVYVSAGMMHMMMYYENQGPCGPGWYTAGMMLASEYGTIDQRITLRWRIVRHGVSSHYIIPMRFPDNASWPQGGEEDFCEGSSLSGCSTFLHYGDDPAVHVARHYTFNPSDWHTMRFVRRNLELNVFIDDFSSPVWVYDGTSETLPETVKRPVLQQECPVDGCPRDSAGTEDIQIDWIVIERPANADGT
jgi:hypothetical protein